MNGSPRAVTVPSRVTILLAVIAAIVACGFRLATFNVGNDDYLHLVLGQQLLVGAVPVRDFLDPGELLFYSTSAAAQYLFGRTMLSEVLLDITGFTVAYGLVFAAAARVSRSHLVAALLTAMAVLLFPRLYAYPKLLLYISGLWLAWRYADRPGTSRLVVGAVATAIAFLFRHDHGAAVGVTMLTVIVAVHLREGAAVVARRVGVFALVGLLSVSPFLVFLALNGGIVHHFRVTLETARDEYRRTVNAFPTFRLDHSGWLPRPVPVYTRVNVRWAPHVTDDIRRAAESRYGLAAPTRRDDGTWEYDLTDTSTETLGDIVTDPRIVDTSGFDRTRLRVFQFDPDPNTNAWFYYLTLALSPIALVTWFRFRGHDDANRIPVLATIVMAVWMQGFLMRSASESAVSDVSAISAVLGAWLVARGLTRTSGSWWRDAPAVVVTVAVLSVSLAALWRGEGGYQLDRLLYVLRSEGTRPVHNRLESALRQRAPYEYEATRYVYTCTRPTDRLLLPWYGPDLIYGSGRGFAAGRPYFLSSLGLSEADQQFSLDRLAVERVPIILANDAFENDFSPTFPLVAAHIRSHYMEMGTVGLGDGSLRVFVDRRLTPSGTFGPNHLPCFVP